MTIWICTKSGDKILYDNAEYELDEHNNLVITYDGGTTVIPHGMWEKIKVSK